MEMYVYKVLVTVASTDKNPASVAASVEAACSSLTRDKHRIYVASAQTLDANTRTHEIPDQPFAEPDNDQEMRADDDWMNNVVYPLTFD